jgi:mono/diheme cytochrome c family protein
MSEIVRTLAFSIICMFLASPFLDAEDGMEMNINLGMSLYAKKCEICHGPLGEGNGPSAAFLSSRPADFTKPSFWNNDVDKKMANAIKNGKGEMPSFNLTPNEIEAIIGYIKRHFRYEHERIEKRQEGAMEGK